MDGQRKVGVLRSWNMLRGFGIIRVGPESSLERYWLHVSKIRSGTATPNVNSIVSFEVSPLPVAENMLPQAIRVDIAIAVTAGVAALSQPPEQAEGGAPEAVCPDCGSITKAAQS